MMQTEVVKALEDVELIKGIMQRASNSLTGFSRVLLWWGGAWLALVVLLSLLSSPLLTVSPQLGHTAAGHVYVIGYLLLLAAFAVLVVGVTMGISTYRKAMHDPAISSLTHGLVSIWGAVLLISFAFPFIFALLYAVLRIEVLAPQILQMNLGASPAATTLFANAGLFTPYAHAMEVWLFALALYATRAVTRLAFAGWLAIIFMIIGLVYPLLGMHFGDYFYPGPYSLIILGAYLEFQRRREAI